MDANVASMSNIWNLELPLTPWEVMTRPGDNGDAGAGLCQMVRLEYLQRLRETLLRNLSETAMLPPNCNVDQYIDACMAEMEKDALRRCMMADIYREGMLRMINDVRNCTNDSVTHASLRPAVDLASSPELSDATSAVAATSTSDDRPETDSPPATLNVPADHCDETVYRAFHSQDEERILRLGVDNYRRTGIRPGSRATAGGGVLRADRVAKTLRDRRLSLDVARAYEFRRRMTALPPDSRARLDDELNRRLGPETADAAAAPDPLTEIEQRAVSRKRVAHMVVRCMRSYYEDGLITKQMFEAVARLVSNNLTAVHADVDENTVKNILVKLFSSCSVDKVIADYKDVRRLFQA